MSELRKARRQFKKIAAAIFSTGAIITLLCGLGLNGASGGELHQTAPTDSGTITVKPTVIITETAPPLITEPDKRYYDIPISEEIQDYIFETAERYDVPAELIISIIANESSYRPKATGQAGEQGYMQIHPINFENLSDKLGVNDFYDEKQNIQSGAYMLSLLFNKYETRNEVLMCYNCGEAGARRLWEQGITETQYCAKIAAIIDSLEYKNENN